MTTLKREDFEQTLARFFDDLSKHYTLDGPPAPGLTPRPLDDPLVHELILSFLMWETPRPDVEPALCRLRETMVDYNELRVCLCDEAVLLIGPRYPLARERCLRLRATLREVFLRENGLTLAHLRDEPKRSARAYLDSLPGMTPFVAARVALLGCEAHAFPVDSQLRTILAANGAIEKDLNPEAASARLERSIRAGEALDCYRRLELFAMDRAPKKRRASGADKPASPARAANKAGKA